MLPEAKSYLVTGGLSSGPAAYATIGAFLGGVVGIQVISRIMHHYIPSHVVDCDHSHEEGTDSDEQTDDEQDIETHQNHKLTNGHAHQPNFAADETTKLLQPPSPEMKLIDQSRSRAWSQSSEQCKAPGFSDPYTSFPSSRRPSLQNRMTRIGDMVLGAKRSCTANNKCSGYGDPCLPGCLKSQSRSPTGFSDRRKSKSRPSHPPILRTTTAPCSHHDVLQGLDEEPTTSHKPPSLRSKTSNFRGRQGSRSDGCSRSNTGDSTIDLERNRQGSHAASNMNMASDQPGHHHHVPTNAFLAIGLQTSIAIALHKLPEGFITYATNHANPKLGFSVFMALFIHNITEGFAMALPLYLALRSRLKAMLWSSLLGGVSQPLGAGIAALWFNLAGSRGMAPGEVVYGCMFAITSGVMASVALQLFQESMTMTHNRNMCTLFAFVGMGVLGFSFALTAS